LPRGRLSAFAAGFGLAAAEAVCGSGDLDEPDVADPHPPVSHARLAKTNSPVTVHWLAGAMPREHHHLPQAFRVSVCLALLLLYGLLKDAQQGERCSRRKLRRLFREFDEDADPPRPAARRPWQGQALELAGELFSPDGTVGLIFLIAHLRLSEPERVTIAHLAALISESTRRHGPGTLPSRLPHPPWRADTPAPGEGRPPNLTY
jgi:hypothetical protein